MRVKFFENVRSFYLIGVGGISMSAIAAFLLLCNYDVSGSDREYNERIRRLEERGLTFFYKQSADNIADYDVIIYTDAIQKDDTEYLSAVKKGKLTASRAEFLNIIGASFKRRIYIAGSHGKTTTTGIIAHIFDCAKEKFAVHIGGEDLDFSNFTYLGDDFFISEACEYKKNILKLRGDTAVLLNSDCDHMECYKDEEELKSTYYAFLRSAKNAVVFSRRQDGQIAFLSEKGEYTAEDITSEKERYSFTAAENGVAVTRINLKVIGIQNVYNALAAVAVARLYGIDPVFIRAGTESFKGIKRRFEQLGKKRGALIFADYAHHPKEIENAVMTAEKLADGDVFIIFQPHTYSRTKYLLNGFISALRNKNVLIFKTYPARESYDKEGDGKLLAEKLNARYGESAADFKDFILKAKRGDVILVLGAGDIYDIFKKLKINR